jgi:hypothetical protein
MYCKQTGSPDHTIAKIVTRLYQGKGGGLTKSSTTKTRKSRNSNSVTHSAPMSAPMSVSSGKPKMHAYAASNAQSKANDLAITYGGLEEEDKMVEQKAAHSSPIKQGKRLTNNVIYFITYFSVILNFSVGHCQDQRNFHSYEAGKTSMWITESDEQGSTGILSDKGPLASGHGPNIFEVPCRLF